MIDWLLSEIKDAIAPPEAARFALDFSFRQVTLVERTRSGVRIRGVADRAGPDFDNAIRRLRRIVARKETRPACVDLLLPLELTLYRIETFPEDAKTDLRREAWWRLERWAPYRAEELCYDVSILETDERTGFLSVAAAVTPREIVDEAVAYAREWGFRPQRVSVATDDDGFPEGPLFLLPGKSRQNMRALRSRALTLFTATMLLVCIGAYRGVIVRQAAADAAEMRLAQTTTELEAAMTVRRTTKELARRSIQPLEARESRYMAVEKMRALSAALPTYSAVYEVVLDGARLRVTGESDNVEAIVARLNQSPVFDAVVEAETAPSARPGLRRFAVEARILDRKPDQ